MENESAVTMSVAKFTSSVALIWLAFSCSEANATTHPGPPDDVPELLDRSKLIESYNTDVEYRKRRDKLSMSIWQEVDPAKIVVSRFEIANFNFESFLSPRSSGLPFHVIERFRVTPFEDLSLRFDVARDDQLSEIMTGNSVWTGSGKNYWDKFGDKDVEWQITIVIRGTRMRQDGKFLVTMQMDSVEGVLVVKPIEAVIAPVPDEFRGLYLVINYDLRAISGDR